MASLLAQTVKSLPGMRETWVWSLGWEDPLEKEMATHSSTLAWKIPWTEEPGRLQLTGKQRVRHNWATSLSFSCCVACGILVPWPEIKPKSPALGAWSLNYWTTREVPPLCFDGCFSWLSSPSDLTRDLGSPWGQYPVFTYPSEDSHWAPDDNLWFSTTF